jgi:hypothetical protein
MSKLYMRLYHFFTSIANYFWKKALAPGQKKINKKEGEQMKKGLTPKQKKLPKGLQEAILKKQKSTRKKKGKK